MEHLLHSDHLKSENIFFSYLPKVNCDLNSILLPCVWVTHSLLNQLKFIRRSHQLIDFFGNLRLIYNRLMFVYSLCVRRNEEGTVGANL